MLLSLSVASDLQDSNGAKYKENMDHDDADWWRDCDSCDDEFFCTKRATRSQDENEKSVRPVDEHKALWMGVTVRLRAFTS